MDPIAWTLLCIFLVGLMVWDQISLRQMTPVKWLLVPVMVALSAWPVWIQ